MTRKEIANSEAWSTVVNTVESRLFQEWQAALTVDEREAVYKRVEGMREIFTEINVLLG